MATTNSLSQPWQNLLSSAIDNQISTQAVEKSGDTMSGTLYLYNSAATAGAYNTQSVTGGTTTNLVYQPSLVVGSNSLPYYTTTSGSTTTTTNYCLSLNGNVAIGGVNDIFYDGAPVGLASLAGAKYYKGASTVQCNLTSGAQAQFTCQSVGHFHSICITWGSNNPGNIAGQIVNPIGGIDPNWVSTTTYEYTLFNPGAIPTSFLPSTNGRYGYAFFSYAAGTTMTNPDILNMPCSYEIAIDGHIYLRLYPTAGDLQSYNSSTATTFTLALPNICISWVDVA